MSLLLDLLFPKICYSCHKSGKYLCSKCLSLIKTKSIKINPKSKIEGFVSIFKYESAIKNLIYDLKYRFVTDLSDELAFIIAKRIRIDFKNLLKYWQKNDFVVMPVPLHFYRENWRGFNQSSLIGQKVAQKLRLKFSEKFFKRYINTISQTKIKDKSHRKGNVADIFSVFTNDIPQNVILFDDVLTTASTLNSLGNIIKSSKQNQIWALTIAG